MSVDSRETVAILTRVPLALKVAVKESAKQNCRSLSSEIEFCLSRAYAPSQQGAPESHNED